MYEIKDELDLRDEKVSTNSTYFLVKNVRSGFGSNLSCLYDVRVSTSI
jgi:hypothetical protein